MFRLSPFGIVGLGSPNLSLTYLGLPNDCFQHASLDVVIGPHFFPIGTQAWSALTLPALPPSFAGLPFYCQSVTLTSAGVGLTTRVSNGLKCVVGLL